MLHYAHILFFTVAVLAILAFTERGEATSLPPDVIVITSGCYTIGTQRTCPPELKGYVPVSAGPGDVFLIDPYNNIIGPGQHHQQQQVQQTVPGKQQQQQQQQQHQHHQQQQQQQEGSLIYSP